ncbi:General secretion pathway, M protein [compost metagenome]
MPSHPTGDLRVWLEKSAAEQAIPLQALKEQSGQIQMTLAVVNAEDLLRWIWQLETQGGVRVLELSLQASSSPDGRVRVETLRVERQ